jgi:hypothetical protein
MEAVIALGVLVVIAAYFYIKSRAESKANEERIAEEWSTSFLNPASPNYDPIRKAQYEADLKKPVWQK